MGNLALNELTQRFLLHLDLWPIPLDGRVSAKVLGLKNRFNQNCQPIVGRELCVAIILNVF